MFNNECDQPASQADAYREMVRNVCADAPVEQCWVLTPYDTWERNPNYVGPEEPHPEYAEENNKLTIEDDPRFFPAETHGDDGVPF